MLAYAYFPEITSGFIWGVLLGSVAGHIIGAVIGAVAGVMVGRQKAWMEAVENKSAHWEYDKLSGKKRLFWDVRFTDGTVGE